MAYVHSFDRTIEQQLDQGKQEYQQYLEKLSPETRQHKQVLEHLMNTATLGLFEADQTQSQLNFYKNQLEEMKQIPSLIRAEEAEPER